MNIMQTAEGFLYVVSAALYYPVTLGLVALVFYMLVLIGGLTRDHLDRQRGQRPALEKYRRDLIDVIAGTGREHRDLEIEALLQKTEHRMSKPLERARFIVRGGPGIGLMGTLIPMGVALAALAQGSMPSMAQHMVHAFNSAVVGLGSGVIAFAIALVREQWIRADIIDMRYLTEHVAIEGTLPGGTDKAVAAGQPAGETA